MNRLKLSAAFARFPVDGRIIAPTPPPGGPRATSPSAGGIRRSPARTPERACGLNADRAPRTERRRSTGLTRPVCRAEAGSTCKAARRIEAMELDTASPQSPKRLLPRRRRPSENTGGASRMDTPHSDIAIEMTVQKPNAGASLQSPPIQGCNFGPPAEGAASSNANPK